MPDSLIHPPPTNPLESGIRKLAKRVGLPTTSEFERGYSAHWYDWKTGERFCFRRSRDGDELGSVATSNNGRLYLLVNPQSPDPRLEVWSAPPPHRPVLAMWIFSLLVSYVTWFRLRRREKQRVAKS